LSCRFLFFLVVLPFMVNKDEYIKRRSSIVERPRDALRNMSVEILSTAAHAQPCEKSHFKACNRRMTLNSRLSEFPLFDRPHDFLLVVRTKNICFLHRFRCITAFTFYVKPRSIHTTFKYS